MSQDTEKPVPLNVVHLDTSGLNKDAIAEHIGNVIDSLQLESLAIVGVGRYQGISVSFCNFGYDPVRLVGALNIACSRAREGVDEVLGLGDTDE